MSYLWRDACMEEMRKFADANGFPLGDVTEGRQGDVATFISKSPDGLEFGVGHALTKEEQLNEE